MKNSNPNEKQALIEDITAQFPMISQCVASQKLFVQSIAEAESLLNEMSFREVFNRLVDNDHYPRLVLDLIGLIMPETYFADNVRLIEVYIQLLSEGGYGGLTCSFAEKLLRNNEYEPTQYEIAAAALMSVIFDPGTLELEKPLPDSRKNSDIFGLFHGQPVRVEVKRIKIEPPDHNEKEKEIVYSADIGVGYYVGLNKFLLPGDGISIKESIEHFYALISDPNHSKRNCRGDIDFNGFVYRKQGNEYACTSVEMRSSNECAPFNSIVFVEASDERSIHGPVRTAATMSTAVRDDLGIVTTRVVQERPEELTDNPELIQERGMCFESMPSPTHRETPTSRKFYNEIQVKLRQLEAGCINLVIIGNPDPTLDSDLADAMLGTSFALFDRDTEYSTLCRVPAPFSPIQNDITDEFILLSGVIGIRIGSIHRFHQLLNNPNATRPLSDEFVSRISGTMEEFVWI